MVLSGLSSANGIEITTAIWFYAGRLPALRTLASATLSVVVVGMDAALGREGALIAVVTATLVARTIEPRSVYDARLSDAQVRDRERAREHAPEELQP